jgi:LacI family transcriptional regulator, galactose operon repressor
MFPTPLELKIPFLNCENKERVMTSIREVAKRLNVSITTVSRALDGYSDVAESTRQLVIKTAQEMGYVPNPAARELRRRRTDSIGYILPAPASEFSDPFFSEFITGLSDEATSNNFDLIVSSAAGDSPPERQRYERWVNGKKVEGVILNRMRLHDWRVQYLAQTSLPFVSLERSLDQSDHPSVEVDNQGGFQELLAYLTAKGHRCIAYVGGPYELKIQADRFEGYKKGLRMAGIPFDPNLVFEADMTRAGGYNAAKRLLKLDPLPTAITCFNDLTAIGVLHAVHEHGLTVGRDLAVAGFDGIKEAEHSLPPLTTLQQPLYDIARTLVRVLIAVIHEQPLQERRQQIRPVLTLRESTEG